MNDIAEPVFQSWYIDRLIGKGGFGKVYEIVRKDEFLDTEQRAALKVISVPGRKEDVERTAAEFLLMEKLKGSSYIVSYEDHEIRPQEDGKGCDILIRMELLTSLEEYRQETAFDEGDVVRLGIDLCRALELCQQNHIVHRDIKPENIFVSPGGTFKLGDFGVARVVEQSTIELTRIGTMSFVAPEVFRGEAYGSAADIYSLGLVMYHLMNDDRGPFLPRYPREISADDRKKAAQSRIQGKRLAPPCHASKGLAAIILRACAFRAEDRYATATEMRAALEALGSGEAVRGGSAAVAAAAAISRTPAAAAAETGHAPKAAGPERRPSRGRNRPPAAAAAARPPATAVGPNRETMRITRIPPKKRTNPLVFILPAVAVVVIIALVAGVFLLKGDVQHESSGETPAVEQKETQKDTPEETNTSEEEDKEQTPDATTYVFAHRGTGGSDETYASFDSMVDQGAKYIEQDVVLAEDGELYVSNKRLSYGELQAQGKLKLRDVFDRYGQKVTYVVELKTRDKKTAKAFVKLVKKFGYEENAIVQCFELGPLKYVRKKEPKIGTLFLCDESHGGEVSFQEALDKKYVDSIAVSFDEGMMTKGHLKDAHAAGKKFGAWVLDLESSIREAIDMGVDFYFTREPASAIGLEKKYRKTER